MAPLLLLSLLLLLDALSSQAHAAVIGGAETGDTTVDWQRGLMVHSVAGSCYVTSVPTDRAKIQAKPNRLYATDPLTAAQVMELNTALATDCPTDDSWWLSEQRPNLPTLSDYLLSYSANTSHSKEPATRARRSADHRPTNTLRRRLQDISRRLAEGTLTAAQVREGGGRVLLTNDPYPSPLFERSATDGQRFKHYRAFYDEIARNSKPQSDARNPADTNSDNQLSDRNPSPQNNVLNSYSLRVRGNSRAEDQKEGTDEERQNSGSNRSGATLQLQHGQQARQYEIYGNSNVPSNNGKRHVSNSNGNRRRKKPLRLHHSTPQHIQQPVDDIDQSLHIPDSIIKDGQVFYRHDATADSEGEDAGDELISESRGTDDAGGDDYSDANSFAESSDSLIFSQAQGSTGNDGSFRAEAEGHGRYGESTHSAVDGNQNGASASSSAIRFDQHALAHVQVNPSSGNSQSSGSVPQVVTQTPVSASEIEQMMRRNGYTGFAMATVKARKKTDNGKPLSNLGHILPGFSSAGDSVPAQDPVDDHMEEEEKHVMVDSIVEQVYNPSDHGIIIDHGGLDGGAGAPHRESEFQQINSADLPEGGVGVGDDQSVGLATYTQGVHGYPPAAEAEYQDLYHDFDKYNFNQPLYFPEYDIDSGAELDGVNGGHGEYSEPREYLPTNLNTGIQYPIIQGDVSVPPLTNGNTMIVDNTLSSYFPQPHSPPEHEYPHVHQPLGSEHEYSHVQQPLRSEHEYSHVQQPHVNTGNRDGHTYNLGITEGDTHSMLDSDVPIPPFQPGSPYDAQHPTELSPYGSDTEGRSNGVEGSEESYYSGIPLTFPSSSGFDENARVDVMDEYPASGQGNLDHVNIHRDFEPHTIPQLPPDTDNVYIGSESNDPRNQYSVQSGHGREDHLAVPTGGSATQPAYNSLWEYERSQRRKLAEGTGSETPNGGFYNQPGNFEPENAETTPNASGNDDAQLNTNDGHSRRETFEDDGFDSEDDDYDDNSYKSSFETSSQSTSQSAQSVYTASHHYSFQHGSSERGIGSSTNTALGKPAIEVPDLVPSYNYYSPDEQEIPQHHQRPTAAPHGMSPLPSATQQQHSLPRQPFPIQLHGGQPSASQGVERMQVISPGGPGSMQSLPSSDASLSEVKVVMAEAPSPGDQMERMGKVIMAGEKIPGTTGYMVPPGFRGRLVLGNFGVTSMSNANMFPGMSMQLSNHAYGQFRPSTGNDNMQMRLGSSSSASSSGSGVSLSSSSSSMANGGDALSAMSSSSSNGNGGRNQNLVAQNQPVYSYQQTYNPNPNFQHPNAIVGPYMPNMGRQDNNPGMRSKSWSSWKTSSWRSSGRNGNMGQQGGNPASRGQYVSQSSAMPDSSDCGYWSMNCRMIQSPFQQSEICRPAHVVLPCCC